MTATPEDVQAKLAQAQALITAAADEAGQLVAPPPPPPAPAPLPPVVFDPDPMGWDATTAKLDPNSTVLAKDFIAYALPFGAYIAPNIAYGLIETDGSTVEYAVSTSGKPGASGMDATIYVPAGVTGSFFNDHHLTVIDRKRGRQHDLWRTTWSGGKLTGWSGGSSIQIGQLQQPTGTHVGSNESNLNGMAGVMTPEQVKAGDLSHPIVFACPQPGAGANRYPAVAGDSGYTWVGHLPPASWLRFPPGLVFPSMDAASLYLCKRIQARGMFLSDLNSSDLSFKSADLGGNLSSRAAWQAAGVTLGSTSGAYKLSSAIPWSQLQVLAPPA